MDIEKLIEQLRWWADNCDRTNYGCQARPFLLDAATALSTLKGENEKMRAELECARESLDFARTKDAEIVRLGTELEQVKRLYESEKEDFIDFACSGVPNLTPYCLNRRPDCVDERGWCRTEKCKGFSRERG